MASSITTPLAAITTNDPTNTAFPNTNASSFIENKTNLDRDTDENV